VAEGFKVGSPYVSTLMKRMGLEALYHKPNNSKSATGHHVYSSLLRKLPMTRPNQVAATFGNQAALVLGHRPRICSRR